MIQLYNFYLIFLFELYFIYGEGILEHTAGIFADGVPMVLKRQQNSFIIIFNSFLPYVSELYLFYIVYF